MARDVDLNVFGSGGGALKGMNVQMKLSKWGLRHKKKQTKHSECMLNKTLSQKINYIYYTVGITQRY